MLKVNYWQSGLVSALTVLSVVTPAIAQGVTGNLNSSNLNGTKASPQLSPQLSPQQQYINQAQQLNAAAAKFAPIPDASGAINPFDLNRLPIFEGIKDSFSEQFKHPEKSSLWYSMPDEKSCQADFENAWTYTAKAIAPEVEVYSVRLPNQKSGSQSFIIGAVQHNFPIVVPSVFGQVLVKNGARALICRSLDDLHIFNLDGRKASVMVRLSSGKILAIGPGSELVLTKSKDSLLEKPSDGIARRGTSPIFSVDDTLIAVNEFWPPSVLKASGLNKMLASTESGGSIEAMHEKQFYNSIIKSGAVLAVMKGAAGYSSGPTQPALVHKASPATSARDTNHSESKDVIKTAKKIPTVIQKHKIFNKEANATDVGKTISANTVKTRHAKGKIASLKLKKNSGTDAGGSENPQQASTPLASSASTANTVENGSDDKLAVAKKTSSMKRYSDKFRSSLRSTMKSLHFNELQSQPAADSAQTKSVGIQVSPQGN